MAILKTAFPLLALSMEMIVDQISTRFKPSPEEDIFRLITALLSDSLQQFIARASLPQDDGLLAQATITNIARFAENLHPIGIKVSASAAGVETQSDAVPYRPCRLPLRTTSSSRNRPCASMFSVFSFGATATKSRLTRRPRSRVWKRSVTGSWNSNTTSSMRSRYPVNISRYVVRERASA